jgi:DNA invertase Pin-like site-specific DNA recombinase
LARALNDAVAYYRTSSATNVGDDKDSLVRQQRAVAHYARANRLAITAEFYDAAVKGTDAIEDRPGFAEMLAKIEGNGVRTVIVEDPSRFARSVLAQELGVLVMKARGVRVLTASGEDLTETDDPARVMIRQVGAAFAQFEKARLVQKLRAARERRKAAHGRCEGRKPVPEETVAEARKLARRSRKTGRRLSLRAISAALAERGHTVVAEVDGKRVPTGRPYGPESVKRMLAD